MKVKPIGTKPPANVVSEKVAGEKVKPPTAGLTAAAAPASQADTFSAPAGKASASAAAAAVGAPQPTEAEVATFVRDWFKRLDQKVPEAEVLPLLQDKGLNFQIPGITLKNHQDFKRTYALIRALLGDKSAHVIEQVDVKRTGPNTFDAHNRHRWNMKVFNVVPISMHLDEHWKVEAQQDGTLKISEYLGRFAP